MNPPARPHPECLSPAPLSNINLPASLNFSPEVLEQLSALGLGVAVVVFEGLTAEHPRFAFGDLEERLDQALNDARAGWYESTGNLPTQEWMFFNATNIASAIAALKAALQRFGLCSAAKILTVESPTECLTWFPATGKIIRAPESEP